MFHYLVRISILCALCVGVVGCGESGPKLTPVKGSVSYNGQPVADATVTFIPAEGPLAVGKTDASGQFTLTTGGEPGAVLGDHTVGIKKVAESGAAAGAMSPDDMRKMQMEAAKEAPEAPKSEIPEKYANAKTSGLKATVTGDSSKDNFEFPLTD